MAIAQTSTAAAANVIAVVTHTVAYLGVMGLIAWIVYHKLGLSLLRKAWINLDWLWAGALVVAASSCC